MFACHYSSHIDFIFFAIYWAFSETFANMYAAHVVSLL